MEYFTEAKIQQHRNKRTQAGFAALLATVIIFGVLLVVIGSLGVITINGQKVIRDTAYSAQAYYAAESGLEDTLYRIITEKKYSTTNDFQAGSGQVNISVADNGSQKTITTQGEKSNLFRNLQAVLATNTDEISFHYGVQVGAGGLLMSNNSRVEGNVYSNGPVSGGNGASITGDVWVAGGKTLSRTVVGGDARAYNITSCPITGDAYYQTISDSSVGGVSHPGSPDPAEEALPISPEQINVWKAQGEAGGVHNGNYTISGTSAALGPKKIQGDLIVTNGARLTVTGTIFVSGNINISNNAWVIQGDNYQDASAVVLADGFISVSNNAVFQTSSSGAYLLFLSTRTGGAITIANNANAVIFYASQGSITVANNAHLKEATGYQITLANGSVVTYESGLASARFSSGSGASWQISSWEEIP